MKELKKNSFTFKFSTHLRIGSIKCKTNRHVDLEKYFEEMGKTTSHKILKAKDVKSRGNKQLGHLMEKHS